jgi:dolichol-phosphate mannosyltransferase
MKKISFVIPVYRNERAVSKTHECIKNLFLDELSTDYEFEIIFVDDGSDDRSLPELLDLHELDKRVKVLSFTRNFGQMSAMLAGFKFATGEAIINISADLQDPVELIPKMLNQWSNGAEIVICHRVARNDGLWSSLFSRIAYKLLSLSSPSLPAGGFDFVLIGRKALDVFNSIDVRNRFFQGDLLWTGYATVFIPYIRQKRLIGKSQYTFWKKFKNFVDAFLDASYLPIRFISAAGAITAIVGFVYAITIIVSWFFGMTPFLGWAPIVISVMVVGGLNMLMLGIVGEYVWRIYDEIRGKPNYIIKDLYL